MRLKILFSFIILLQIASAFGETFTDSCFAFSLHYNDKFWAVSEINRGEFYVQLGLISSDKRMSVVFRATDQFLISFSQDSEILLTRRASFDSSLMSPSNGFFEHKGHLGIKYSGRLVSNPSLFSNGVHIVGNQTEYTLVVTADVKSKDLAAVLLRELTDSLEISNYYVPLKNRKRLKEYAMVEVSADSVYVNGMVESYLRDLISKSDSSRTLAHLRKLLSKDFRKNAILLVDDGLPYLLTFRVICAMEDSYKGNILLDNVSAKRRNVFTPNTKRFHSRRNANLTLSALIQCNNYAVSLFSERSRTPIFFCRYQHSVTELTDTLLKKLEILAHSNKSANDIDDILVAAGGEVPSIEVIELMNIAKKAGFVNVSLSMFKRR